MANQIPFAEGTADRQAATSCRPSRATSSIQAILLESGAIALAGDVRATSRDQDAVSDLARSADRRPGRRRRRQAGRPAPTFGQAFLNVKKFASIVLFTDEMIEDVQGGDLNVLVDSASARAINAVDRRARRRQGRRRPRSPACSTRCSRATTSTVEYDQTKPDGLQKAVSAAMGVLEANGYGDASEMGVAARLRLLAGAPRRPLDARPVDADLRGGPRPAVRAANSVVSTNLNNAADAPAATKILGFVVHRPNLHVRHPQGRHARRRSSEATVNDGIADRKLFQENLTAVRYETRLAFLVHDINRAVVAIKNAT